MAENGKWAVLFPGQGSQSVGMLGVLEDLSFVQELFSRASQVLGYDLFELVTSGPEDLLHQTEKTQPALLACSIAMWQRMQACSAKMPAFFGGHSLGEYSALVAAGVIDFETGIRLVAHRGFLMQQAVQVGSGSMAAVLGLTGEVVSAVCKGVHGFGELGVANFNAPLQVVIAGENDAVAEAVIRLRKQGAKRVVALPVSVPSHCALMRRAAENFAAMLDATPFSDATVPIVQNVDAGAQSRAQHIKSRLLAQLYSSVQWVRTIEYLRTQQIVTILECGPGRVLSGLCRQIDRGLLTFSLADEVEFNQAIKHINMTEEV